MSSSGDEDYEEFFAESTKDFDLPWVEKYRPATLDDCVGNESIIEKLKQKVVEGNAPNMILIGPPGCGKTSSILALSRQLNGPVLESIQTVLEINASDDSKVSLLIPKLEGFARNAPPIKKKIHKIVILDECDSIDTAAQHALRGLMDLYPETRFALACNHLSGVLESIQSRCVILCYQTVSEEQMKKRIAHIVAREKVKMTDEGLRALLFISNGDMRMILNTAELVVQVHGFIDEKQVYDSIGGIPHPKLIKEMLQGCLKKDIDQVTRISSQLFSDGHGIQDIIDILLKCLKQYTPNEKPLISESNRLAYIKIVAETKKRASQGLITLVQLDSMLAKMCRD